MKNKIIIAMGGFPVFEDCKNGYQSDTIELLREKCKDSEFEVIEIPNCYRGVKKRIKLFEKELEKIKDEIFVHNVNIDIFLFGNSMAGSAVLVCQKRYPDFIKGTVAINAPFCKDCVRVNGLYLNIVKCLCLPDISRELPTENVLYFYSRLDETINNKKKLDKLNRDKYKGVKKVGLNSGHRFDDVTRLKVIDNSLSFYMKLLTK